MRRATLVAAAIALSAATSASASPLLQGPPITWVYPKDAFLSGAVTAKVDDDATPDVVIAHGDRDVYGGFLFPPANPRAQIELAKTFVRGAAAELVALDGRDGSRAWAVEWAAARGPGEPARGTYHLVEGVDSGDFDRDGRDEVLVLRLFYPGGQEPTTLHTSLYDAATGRPVWDRAKTLPAGEFEFRSLTTVDVGSRTFALITSSRFIGFEEGYESSVEVLDLSGPEPRTRTRFAPERGLVYVDGLAYEDGLRLFASRFSYDIFDGRSPQQLRAFQLDPHGDAPAVPVWSKSGAAGWPMVVVGGRSPSVVVGQGHAIARDIADGSELWRNPVRVFDEAKGALAAGDLNADGWVDVVASPVYGFTVSESDFTSEVTAVDGRTGGTLWTLVEPAAKYGARALTLSDVAGDGRPEVIASFMHQDGFPFVGQFYDDPGLTVVYEGGSGFKKCAVPTERLAPLLLTSQLDPDPGSEVIIPTYSGTTYAFEPQPLCGV